MYYRFLEIMHDKASVSIQRETIKQVLRKHHIHMLAVHLLRNLKGIRLLSSNGIKKLLILFLNVLGLKVLVPLTSVFPKNKLFMIGQHLNRVDGFILSFIDSCDLRPCGPIHVGKDLRVRDLNLIFEMLKLEDGLQAHQNSEKKQPDRTFQGLWRRHIILETIEGRRGISESFENSIRGVFYSGKVYVFFLMGVFVYLFDGSSGEDLLLLGRLIGFDLYFRLAKILLGITLHIYGKRHMARWKTVLMAMQKCMHIKWQGQSSRLKKIDLTVRRWERKTVLMIHHFGKQGDTIPVGYVFLCMGVFVLVAQIKQWL